MSNQFKTRPPPNSAAIITRRPPATDGLSLVLIGSSGSQVTAIPLSGDITIGRGEQADLRLRHVAVSRNHAVIRGGLPPTIEDLGSANGTRINGVALAPGKSHELVAGTVITFGSVTVAVQATAQPARFPVVTGQPPLPFVATDPATVAVFKLATTVAPSSLPVLILGETGVGKELVAEHIHKNSHRSSAPLLRLNCASLSESLLESELFGHERGAFTGATQASLGLLESADHGTVFLDEVGEISLATQAKLLRFLESGEVLRIGSTRPRQLDVRIIAATNRDMERLAREGQCRADFYYRLNGISIVVPPLRARADDIVPLAHRFACEAARRQQRPAPHLSPATEQLIRTYSWPGNVRELRKVIERAVVLTTGDVLEPDELQLDVDSRQGTNPARFPSQESATMRSVRALPGLGAEAWPPRDRPSANLRNELELIERDRIIATLQECGGNQSRAARMLGISRRVLMNRIDIYGITRPRKSSL